MTKLLLASTSPARKKLLTEAGIVFDTIAPGVDEEEVVEKLAPSSAHDLTLWLARAKAKAVAGEDLVLGCDSALWFQGEILGKPKAPEVAFARWQQMRGNFGELFSGHYLVDHQSGKEVGLVTSTKVHFANLSDQDIEKYVATKEPLEVAGAFTIDGLGGAFVERIEGDYHTVVGLSLVALRKMMNELGRDYLSLWR
ncbi:MAG: Maf family nucleotide pyrophosphatase [Aquiluna sp.]|nr:Maf family nucleotide pyrophosphatase [Aquiluna sp.]MCF8546255.1 Maf family nucleotide pyrophosphatase [Aquiluna sp.]